MGAGNVTDHENPDVQQPGGLAAGAEAVWLRARAPRLRSASAEAALAGGGEERARRGSADCEGGYNISHLVDARLELGGWF
jgi:hypothetical protein